MPCLWWENAVHDLFPINLSFITQLLTSFRQSELILPSSVLLCKPGGNGEVRAELNLKFGGLIFVWA